MNFADLLHDLRVGIMQGLDALFGGTPRNSRRQKSRIASDVPVEYTVLDGKFEGYRAMAAAVSDISVNGINMLIDKELSKFTILQLRILLSSRTAIALRASVAWQEPAGQAGKFKTGIKFVNISPDTYDTLSDYLRSLSR